MGGRGGRIAIVITALYAVALTQLQTMGLLRWRIGTDLDGEERRTELELRPAPDVSAEELNAAAGAWSAGRRATARR